jgi:hypothetical protein
MPLEGEFLGEVVTYEDEFPPDRRPPAVQNYRGAKLLEARKPPYTVELDAGAFRAVWELLEAEAKHRFPTRNGMASARAYLRAVGSFRAVYWEKNPPVPEPPSRQLKRNPARRQSQPPRPANGRRLIRRKTS